MNVPLSVIRFNQFIDELTKIDKRSLLSLRVSHNSSSQNYNIVSAEENNRTEIFVDNIHAVVRFHNLNKNIDERWLLTSIKTNIEHAAKELFFLMTGVVV